MLKQSERRRREQKESNDDGERNLDVTVSLREITSRGDFQKKTLLVQLENAT